MKTSYRIAIADDDAFHRALLRHCVVEAGHSVAFEAISGEDLVERCPGPAGATVQLVIADINMGALNGLDAAAQILNRWDIPFIVVSGLDDDDHIQRASDYQARGFLVKPIRVSELKAAIAIAAERFHEFCESRTEVTSLRKTLEERKIIERAKGILMREKSLDESDAFKCLQQLAREHRKKLSEVAQSIILASQAFCSN